MECLTGCDRYKIRNIINNHQHELSVLSVIETNSPGEVYVNDYMFPKSFLIKTPECNLIGGFSKDLVFNREIKEKISYYDQLLCDNEEWEQNIPELHPNCAIQSYKRRYFKFTAIHSIKTPETSVQVEYIYPADIEKLTYKNKDIVLDWITVLNIQTIKNLCLGAVVIIDDTIVSCSAIDCIHNESVEIGVKTLSGYRKMGYGVLAVSSFVKELQKNNIKNIGWHCMSTNQGSIRIARECGFSEIVEYQTYFPYPPVENIDDISKNDWIDYGRFFYDKGKISTDQYWQGARCFAKAGETNRVMECINQLVSSNQIWFLAHINKCAEFDFLSNNKEYQELLRRLTN